MLIPLSSNIRPSCCAAKPRSGAIAARHRSLGGAWRRILPRASRRSTPCCPATGSLSGANILSMPAIGRPLTRASAPPAASYRAVSSLKSAAPACTAAGSAAMSKSVPSMSRKNAALGTSGGTFMTAWLARPGLAADRDLALRREHTAAMAHASRVEQHAARPAVDVELLHEVAHAAHARALLVGGHGERHLHRRRALLDVVGIDDQRLGQLARGAGELRQDQYALLVVARGDEFLGHQVHAVVQARDVTQLARAVELVHLRRVVMLDLQDDRLVAVLSE